MTINIHGWLKGKPIVIISMGIIVLLFIVNSAILNSKNKQAVQYPDGNEIEEYAFHYLKGEEGEKQGRKLDCSGFTREVYKHFGIKIPRSSFDQSKQSALLDVNNLEKGNLIFFSINKNYTISHVAIFLENGKFIHSPGRRKYVRIDSLSNSYWEQRFVAGGKIIYQ